MADKDLLDIRFVKIEKLRGRAMEKAAEKGLKEGLAILTTKTGSLPQYEIEEVNGDPLEAIMETGEKEGITREIFDKALDEASKEDG